MNRSLKTVLLLAAASSIMAGCAAQGAAGTIRHNLVTAEQLVRAGDQNLYDALRTIRPTFLRSRQPGTATMPEAPITVYIGGLQMMEGLAHLREIQARSVQEVEFLEPHQANARFGGTNNGGALVIVMKP